MPRLFIRRAAAVAAPVLSALSLWGVVPLVAAGAPSSSALRSRVAQARQRERALSSDVARLDLLVARLNGDATILSGRLSAVQSDLDASVARLAQTRRALRRARAHLRSLRAALTHGREVLAAQLRAQYTSPQSDLVNVLFSATSLSDLLDRADFQRRAAAANANIVGIVRDARDATRTQTRTLADLVVARRASALAVHRQRDALQAMSAQLADRRATLAAARSARQVALRNTRGDRVRAQRELRRLTARRAAAARAVGGPAPLAPGGGGGAPGGPWAIPAAIVMCESGGQNLPPNGATASGYYQMTDATWHGLGGRTAHAFQASKAEQDRAAATLWAGGAGAGNWVCAPLVRR